MTTHDDPDQNSTHPAPREAAMPAWLRAALASAPPITHLPPPPWLWVPDLPAVTFGEGRLTTAQTHALIRALKHSSLTTHHPLLAAILAHADAASRDAFAWALCEQWLAGEAPWADRWALVSVGLLGGEQRIRGLALVVQTWLAAGRHELATLGLDVLRALDGGAAA